MYNKALPALLGRKPRTPYLGPVFTSGMIPNTLDTGGKKIYTRKFFIAMQNIDSVKLCYMNAFLNESNNVLGAEQATGNALTCNAWIEYPAGNYIAVNFSGSTTGQLTNNALTFSDDTKVSIKKGDVVPFWTYAFPTTGNNIPYFHGANLSNNPMYVSGGEGCIMGTSGVPTTPGTFTDNQSGRSGFFPVAIMGMTTKSTFYLLADSRGAGAQEVSDGTYHFGDLARSIGLTHAYINGGVSSERISSFLSSSTLRMQLISYCTNILSELGINGPIQHSSDFNTIMGYVQTLAARFNGKCFARTTMEPVSVSTDQWETVGNQTPTTNVNSVRVLVNNQIRAKFDGVPYCEVADCVESSRDSGKWQSNGSANAITYDGTHETNLGSSLIVAANAINGRDLEKLPPIVTVYPSVNGVAGGTPAFSAGKFSTNGLSAGYGTVYGGIVPGCPPLTMECWIKTSTISSAAYPCGCGPVGFGMDASGNALVRSQNPGLANLTSSVVITDGAWHHLAVTVDATGLHNFYVDGTLAATGTATSWSTQQYLNEKYGFGLRYNGQFSVGTGQFNGIVQEVALWNNIKYTTTFTPPVAAYVGNESNLVGLWHLNSDLSGIRGPAGF